MIFFYEMKEKLKKNLEASSKNEIFKKKNWKYSKKNFFKLNFFPIFFQSAGNYIIKKSTDQFS